jgi:hypothetical protein
MSGNLQWDIKLNEFEIKKSQINIFKNFSNSSLMLLLNLSFTAAIYQVTIVSLGWDAPYNDTQYNNILCNSIWVSRVSNELSKLDYNSVCIIGL